MAITPNPAEWSYPQLLVAALGAGLLVALVVAGSTSTAAFGVFNPTTFGTAEFHSLPAETGAESHVVRDASTYVDLIGEQSTGDGAESAAANGTLAVVLSPDAPYEQTGRLQAFVESGGTLLVAEDVGPHGNEILASVGARARVEGTLLRDERTHGASPAFPVATNVTDHPYTVGVDALQLNYGTAVTPQNATVLASTSPFAYLDTTRNEQLDANETLASYPVATVESVGEGRVITVGDPSLFVNDMLERRDNREFARGIIAAHDRVLFDAVHTGGVPAVVAGRLALQESSWLRLGVGAIVVLSIAGGPLVLSSIQRRRRGRIGERALDPLDETDRESVADAIADRYPDWDRQRVQRVTDTIMTRGPESGANDSSE